MEKSIVDWIAIILVVIGGLNWGLVGLGNLANMGNLDLVQMILGSIPVLRDVVYVLVGLAAIYEIYVVAVKK